MREFLHKHYDVCIIGGGIAGLVTAFALGKKGRKVLVVEKNANFNPNGADVLKPAGIKVLEELGLFDEVIKCGAVKRDRVLIFHGGSLISEMDYTQEHDRKYFLLIPYKKLLEIILVQLQKLSNVHLLFNTALTNVSFNQLSNIESVQLGDNLSVSADVYIGADGITSKLRNLLNIESFVEYYTQRMYFAQFPMVDSVRECNRLYVDKNYSLTYFYPVGKDHYRCVIGFSKGEGDKFFVESKSLYALKERLKTFVTQSDDAIEGISSLDNFATFPLCKMNLDQYYKGNAVFLGNAAHSIHPLTGQGMNLAVEDAGALFTLLEDFFNKKTDLLSAFVQYQQIRHPINTKLIEYGHNLVSAFDDKIKFTNALNLQLQTSNRNFELLENQGI